MNKEIYIVSYPKCGRTWLRALIGTYLSMKYNLPEKKILETEFMSSKAGLLTTSFTHDNSSWMDLNSPAKQKTQYANKKIILLNRNLKDVLISAYFQAVKREGVFSGTISEFIRDKKFGALTIILFYSEWYDQKHVPKKYIHISYEELHNNTRKVLSKVLNFMGESKIDENNIIQAIDYCSFNNLKKAELENRFNSFRLQTNTTNDPESFKVRRGKINGYIDYLSEKDITYINNLEKEYNYASV